VADFTEERDPAPWGLNREKGREGRKERVVTKGSLRLIVIILGVVVMLSGLPGSVKGEKAYPVKPITVVVTHSAGGGVDVSVRLIAEKLKETLGQPVMVLNKPGSHGKVGMQYALGQKPDGYTVIAGMLNDNFVGPYFQGIEPLNPDDFLFVGGYTPIDAVLFTTPDKPYKTLREFVEYVKKNPDTVSVGSAGSRWGLEIMKSIAVKEGLRMRYVTFRGGAEAGTALLGKHVDVCEGGAGGSMFQAARQGKAIPLVVLGHGRVPYFQTVPNLKELGYPYWFGIEYGMALRAGTPEPIRRKLEATLEMAINDPEVHEKLSQLGLSPRFIDGKILKKTVQEATTSVQDLIKFNKALGVE
jgi:tripartite-type tricarboxylate transporter receptor subunit TctC